MSDAVDTPVPQVSSRNVRDLVAVLKREGKWRTRRELAVELGNGKPSWERKVRRIASVARPVVVSFPGSPGYCHLDAVSDDELQHCINAHKVVAKDAAYSAEVYQAALEKRRAGQPRREVQEVLNLA